MMDFSIKPFADLTATELYAIMQLRSEVFVVEQNCVYQDADGKDLPSFHVMGWEGTDLVAYTRLLPAGISFTEVSIGRVVTSPRYRKHGFGKLLMQTSITQYYQLFGQQAIRIGAQLYLQAFYESFGFVVCSEMYLEDDIPHVEMLLQAQL